MFKKIGAGCCRSTSQSENIDQTNPVQTPSLRCNNVAPPLGLFHREMLQTVIALVAGCIEDIICIHHHAFHLRCSDASVSILFHSWTKYYYLSSMISFLFKNLTSLNLLKLLLYGLVIFFLWKIWLRNCRVAKLLFFFYPTGGLNISDGVERVILCLGFYQWSSSSEGWPIGEPLSVIGEENTQYYRLFFDLNCRQMLMAANSKVIFL